LKTKGLHEKRVSEKKALIFNLRERKKANGQLIETGSETERRGRTPRVKKM